MMAAENRPGVWWGNLWLASPTSRTARARRRTRPRGCSATPAAARRVRFPTEVRHIAAAGGDNMFLTESAALRALGPAAPPLAMPPALLRPADVTFTGNGKVRLWSTGATR